MLYKHEKALAKHTQQISSSGEDYGTSEQDIRKNGILRIFKTGLVSTRHQEVSAHMRI